MSEQKNQPEQVQEVKPEVIFEQRKAKIAEFEAAGLKPYGTRYDGAIPTAEAKKLYVEESETQAKVNVAGRMTAFRAMGKAVFADVKDSSGRIQLSKLTSIIIAKETPRIILARTLEDIFFNIVIPAFNISRPTPTLIPVNALATKGMLKKSSKIVEITRMIANDGSTTPSVEKTAPRTPAILYPTKVAQLIAIGPGVDSAITAISIISSWVIHFFLSTQQFSITEIMAYPPPKVNMPIFANEKNNSVTLFMMFSTVMSFATSMVSTYMVFSVMMVMVVTFYIRIIR